jgi:SAM-dependent methyltransferase
MGRRTLNLRRIPSRSLRGEKPHFNIDVRRGEKHWLISPKEFESFPFEDGDQLEVVPKEAAASLPVTWGDVSVPISRGRAIRVPPVYRFAGFKGFNIPSHLVSLTGAGPETLEEIGKAQIENYKKYVGLSPDMTILEVGCGIGRGAFQLLGYLNEHGRYIGIDVTRDSIVWCQQNITRRNPRFVFHHADAIHELYNPFGSTQSTDFRVPIEDGTVDRIVLHSVFTHLLADEVLHYLREFHRVLKPGGLVYASFFLYSADALAAAETQGNTSWKATFSFEYGGGVYGNDPQYPRGAVAYTDDAMKRLMQQAGLQLARPYLKGWWSGLYGDQAEDGQDVAILTRT